MRECDWRAGENILYDIGDVFIKPTVRTGSGKDCFVARFKSGRDEFTGATIREILTPLGEDFAVQERMQCHESVAKIYPGSVNTFRVITYRWKDEILHMPVCMRIGRGDSFLDNAHAGGIFVAVDDDGTLHRMAYTEFNMACDRHPDTGVVFDGYKIESFPKVLQAAKVMSGVFPQVGCINWDFMIGQDGEPVVIEANMRGGSVWLSEMPHGCGPFGERTPEILRWINKMKHTKVERRYLYRYGRE